MKLIRTISAVVLVLLLALVSAGVGCGGKGGGGTARMMNMMPENSSMFIFMDIKALRGDEDLKGFYNEDVGETFGIDIDDIDCIATSDDLVLFDGSFDFDKVRDGLDGRGFYRSEYEGVKMWGTPSGGVWVALVENFDGSRWLALRGNLIVIGGEDAVINCIKVIRGGEDSLQDNQDIGEVMGRLSGGMVVFVGTGEIFSEMMGEEYEGLKAGGMSFEKKDEHTLKVTFVLKFEDEDAARNAMNEAEGGGGLGDEHFQLIGFVLDKGFVKITAEIDIDSFTSFMNA